MGSFVSWRTPRWVDHDQYAKRISDRIKGTFACTTWHDASIPFFISYVCARPDIVYIELLRKAGWCLVLWYVSLKVFVSSMPLHSRQFHP
jgi:hypothetical protein